MKKIEQQQNKLPRMSSIYIFTFYLSFKPNKSNQTKAVKKEKKQVLL